uniref:Uncharacterized protein n=1 Tax=Alexandrium monilatum TaxID=311494 RepID=A0A7S4S4F1_9DINO
MAGLGGGAGASCPPGRSRKGRPAMPGVACEPYKASRLYEGLKSVKVDLGNGVEETVQMDPEQGPKAITLAGNTTYYGWSTPSMHYDLKQKLWKDMSTVEKETMVLKVAKINKSRRELMQNWGEKQKMQAEQKQLQLLQSLQEHDGEQSKEVELPRPVAGSYAATDFESWLQGRFVLHTAPNIEAILRSLK